MSSSMSTIDLAMVTSYLHLESQQRVKFFHLLLRNRKHLTKITCTYCRWQTLLPRWRPPVRPLGHGHCLWILINSVPKRPFPCREFCKFALSHNAFLWADAINQFSSCYIYENLCHHWIFWNYLNITQVHNYLTHFISILKAKVEKNQRYLKIFWKMRFF